MDNRLSYVDVPKDAQKTETHPEVPVSAIGARDHVPPERCQRCDSYPTPGEVAGCWSCCDQPGGNHPPGLSGS